MSFKIVQTTEPGHKLPMLSVVPVAWENNGMLMWPKSAQANKVIQDGSSVPQPGWKTLPCVKKRENFLSYSAAVAERDEMVLRSDSEADQVVDVQTATNKKRFRTNSSTNRKEIGRSPQRCFNSQMENAKKIKILHCESPKSNLVPYYMLPVESHQFQDKTPVLSDYNNLPSLKSVHHSTRTVEKAPTVESQRAIYVNESNLEQQIILPSIQNKENDDLLGNSVYVMDETQQQNKYTIVSLSNEFYEQSSSTDVLSDAIEGSELKIILEKQNIILEQQNKIFEELAKQRTTLEFLCDLCTSSQTNKLVPINEKSNNITTLLPTNNIEKLNELEIFLLKEDNMKKPVNKMSEICGRCGKLNGVNCCYAIVDRFFNREFLTKFSWSGGSRNAEGKAPFNGNKNVMKAFYSIVNQADSEFSELDCQSFFKSVIKNAKRRSLLMAGNMEKKRNSRRKMRPNNLVYNKNKHTTENNENEDVNNIDTENVTTEEPYEDDQDDADDEKHNDDENQVEDYI